MKALLRKLKPAPKSTDYIAHEEEDTLVNPFSPEGQLERISQDSHEEVFEPGVSLQEPADLSFDDPELIAADHKEGVLKRF